MKWYILGARGWIGSEFVKLLTQCDDEKVHESLIFVENKMSARELQEDLMLVQPNVVVSFVGRTHSKTVNSIDYLEDHADINIRDNILAPLLIEQVCQELNIHFTYVGSGCIYNNENNKHEFSEQDSPNFFQSAYSAAKAAVNELLSLKSTLHVRIRMPIVFYSHPRNLVTKLLSFEKVISCSNSVTVLPDALPVLKQMIEDRVVGKFNLVNPGSVTHPDILNLYKLYVQPDLTFQCFNVADQNAILKVPRSNVILSTQKLTARGYALPDIRQSLSRGFQNMVCQESQTVLITGGCGFIGQHVIRQWFHKYPNWQLVNIDKLVYNNHDDHIPLEIVESKRYHFHQCDVCDHSQLLTILRQYTFDFVLHLAGETHVDNSFTNSMIFSQTNVLGTHTLLQCLLMSQGDAALPLFLHMSTDEVYGGDDVDKMFSEKSLFNPTNPYAASKVGAEAIVNAYKYSYKFPTIIVRCNNVYGPNQSPEKLIPKFVCRILGNFKTLPIHGDGEQQRAFVYVTDVVHALDLIRQRGKKGEVYNIADHTCEFTVNEVADMLCNLMSVQDNVMLQHVDDRNFNDRRYHLDTSKLHELGWQVTVPFLTGLQRVIQTCTNSTFQWPKQFYSS